MSPAAHRRVARDRRGDRRRAIAYSYANGLLWAVGNGLISSTLVIYLALHLGAQRVAISALLAAPRLAGVPRLGAPAVFGRTINLQFHKAQDLRYGENPHQRAAFYRESHPAAGTISSAKQLQGKALSFNNIADTDAALESVRQFEQPACVIVKHATPCGVAVGGDC